MNLYEIDKAIMDCVNPETGEIVTDEFDHLMMARDQKIENIGLYIKNLKAYEEALKAEKKAFEKRIKATEANRERLKTYLSNYLDGQKWSSPKVKISFRRSSHVEIEEGTELPEAFIRYGKPEPNKEALKMAINEGAEIRGVSIVKGLSMTVK